MGRSVTQGPFIALRSVGSTQENTSISSAQADKKEGHAIRIIFCLTMVISLLWFRNKWRSRMVAGLGSRNQGTVLA